MGGGGAKKSKKGIIFFKKGLFKGGHNVAKGGERAHIVPPKQKLSYAPVCQIINMIYNLCYSFLDYYWFSGSDWKLPLCSLVL